MIMIDVLNKLAKGEIKDKTVLNVYDHIECINSYTFDGKAFYDEYDREIGTYFIINGKFLNYTVELRPPKEKKYLVKFNMRWLRNNVGEFCYLNYVKNYEYVDIDDKRQTVSHKTHFTKSELRSIQPVREFLEDMQGKFELIEVEDDAVD